MWLVHPSASHRRCRAVGNQLYHQLLSEREFAHQQRGFTFTPGLLPPQLWLLSTGTEWRKSTYNAVSLSNSIKLCCPVYFIRAFIWQMIHFIFVPDMKQTPHPLHEWNGTPISFLSECYKSLYYFHITDPLVLTFKNSLLLKPRHWQTTFCISTASFDSDKEMGHDSAFLPFTSEHA